MEEKGTEAKISRRGKTCLMGEVKENEKSSLYRQIIKFIRGDDANCYDMYGLATG